MKLGEFVVTIGLGLLLLLGLVFVLAKGCTKGSPAPSALVGQWRSNEWPGVVSLHPDGVASVFNVRCHWKRLSKSAARIERCLESIPSWGNELMADFRLTSANEARLSFGDADFTFLRVAD